MLRLSTLPKAPLATSVSGLGTAEASKPNLLHVEKVQKVRSERSFERLIRLAQKKAPGVGTYKNTESAFDRTSRGPPSLAKKRH